MSNQRLLLKVVELALTNNNSLTRFCDILIGFRKCSDGVVFFVLFYFYFISFYFILFYFILFYHQQLIFYCYFFS